MTPTDDERREVARRLQGLRPGACFDDVYEALGAYGPNPYASRVLSATWFARYLADLIEPSCDREALLALAGEMYRDGRMQRERQKAGGHWFVDGLDVMDYARRIREACGVAS